VARIVVLDLLFNWPPEGGARVDTLELTRFLSARHRTTMLVPRILDAFPRGRVDVSHEELGIDLEVMPVPMGVADHRQLCDIIRDRLEELSPDLLFIGDAWHLKARLLAALTDYAPVVRFYAHESLCLKGHGHQYRDEQVCPIDTLAQPNDFASQCLPCRQAWAEATTTKAFDREMKLAAIEDGTYLDELRRGLAAARAVVVTNTYMVVRLSPHTKRVILQPMGVNLDMFRPVSPPTGKRFLLHGRVYDYLKGAHVLIEAGRRLREQGRDFTIAVTGLPPGQTDEDLPDFVEVLEPVPHDQVPGVIESALCSVLPPVWPEPLPLSALESMACGRPLIASAVGGFKDLIVPGQNGLRVPPNDPAALAEAMARVLDDRALLNRLAEGAVATAWHHRWTDLHENAYGPLLAEL
jgi:glycosyltransferase involved in cell wall biosynthesis